MYILQDTKWQYDNSCFLSKVSLLIFSSYSRLSRACLSATSAHAAKKNASWHPLIHGSHGPWSLHLDVFMIVIVYQGLVDVLIEHHPTIGDIITNKYLKVMFIHWYSSTSGHGAVIGSIGSFGHPNQLGSVQGLCLAQWPVVSWHTEAHVDMYGHYVYVLSTSIYSIL